MLDSGMKKDLQKLALKIRIGAVEEFKARGFGHVGGSLRDRKSTRLNSSHA